MVVFYKNRWQNYKDRFKRIVIFMEKSNRAFKLFVQLRSDVPWERNG